MLSIVPQHKSIQNDSLLHPASVATRRNRFFQTRLGNVDITVLVVLRV